MKKIVEINTNQKFYLSADVNKRELGVYYDNFDIIDFTDINPKLKFMLEKFNSSINNNRLIHLINVIDLFSLSHCSFLLAHIDSTWSQVAGYYNRTPFINVSFEKFDEESFIESMSD